MVRQCKTELYAAIRRDVHGLSIRTVMRKHGVSHPTVRQALDSAWPKPRKKMVLRTSLLDPFKPLIDAMLRADPDAPRKQRHAVKRIFDRLVDEHEAPVSYGIVRRYVAERRPQVRVEASRGPVEAFISQTHRPGAEAEVDFGDVTVRIGGQQVTCYLFRLRLSYLGKAVHRVFTSSGQEAFFEGHVHALEVLGGVPFGKIRYDNLKAAVAQILGFTRAGWRPSGGRRSGRTTGSRASTAARGSRARTRRARWRGRSGGFAVTTSSRCARLTRWPS